MRSRPFHVSALLLLSLFALAEAKGTYRVFSSNSRAGFSISHLSNRAEGRFQKVSGTLKFSKQDPDASQVKVSIEVASIDTANKTRDTNLRGVEYFDAVKYPTMTFQSKSFKKVGAGKYMVTGPLTIKGHSKNISVPVTLVNQAKLWASGEESLKFQAEFEIDRTEFGVGEKSSLLGSEVRIQLALEFRDEP